MNESEVSQYISETFEGAGSVSDAGNSFFFYNPDGGVPSDRWLPFVTLMTNDLNDQFSDLDRPGVFRLNIGIGKQTFRSLFGEPALPSYGASSMSSSESASPYDFTALDQIMPHPVYGRMFWVCVLNPGEETFETSVRQLLAEAYELEVSKYQKRATHR